MKDNLLAQLLRGGEEDSNEAWSTVQATEPEHDRPTESEESDPRLAELLARLRSVTDGPLDKNGPTAEEPSGNRNLHHGAARPSPAERFAAQAAAAARDLNGEPGFVPIEPESLEEAGVLESEVVGLALKYLGSLVEATGRSVAEQIKLPFRLVDPILQTLKADRLVAHRGASMVNDYIYELTDRGRDRARKLSQISTYYGSAPVPLRQYIASVEAQSITKQRPTREHLEKAFDDLLINQRMLRRLGPAINSGRGLFLFGPPGNGKTSIAERITRAFGEAVWIPRSISFDGEIMRVFDPGMHEEIPLSEEDGLLKDQKIDRRWIYVRRPTIVVGGELTMNQLEVMQNRAIGISESPVQLKSNTGTLVIDDFGRQRMSTDELLNRWIVPLEKRYDFLNLSSGKKIQVPFDQLIVFSTNLEPRDLVDDAFLRRIPYKIEVIDPTEEEFRELFKIMAPIIGVEYSQAALDYLITTHYRSLDRPFRCCQPRDLLAQIRNHCLYVGEEPQMTNEYFDYAVENYFAVM